jgi:hypothetical protein
VGPVAAEVSPAGAVRTRIGVLTLSGVIFAITSTKIGGCGCFHCSVRRFVSDGLLGSAQLIRSKAGDRIAADLINQQNLRDGDVLAGKVGVVAAGDRQLRRVV